MLVVCPSLLSFLVLGFVVGVTVERQVCRWAREERTPPQSLVSHSPQPAAQVSELLCRPAAMPGREQPKRGLTAEQEFQVGLASRMVPPAPLPCLWRAHPNAAARRRRLLTEVPPKTGEGARGSSFRRRPGGARRFWHRGCAGVSRRWRRLLGLACRRRHRCRLGGPPRRQV